jgi:hypothetical protein
MLSILVFSGDDSETDISFLDHVFGANEAANRIEGGKKRSAEEVLFIHQAPALRLHPRLAYRFRQQSRNARGGSKGGGKSRTIQTAVRSFDILCVFCGPAPLPHKM